LADLAERVGGVWHRATADPDRRGIRVGFLSRLPLHQVRQISAFPAGVRPIQVDDTPATQAAMGRPALHVQIHVGDQVIDLVTCHLKSKLLGFPDGRFAPRDEQERARFAGYALSRRAAEAVTVRAAATALLTPTAGAPASAGVVVLGDLNDEASAATTQILSGPPGSEIGTPGYAHPDQGDAQRLWNLADRIPAEQRYSRIYRGRRELIDHILVSHTLVDLVDDGAVSTGGSPPPSITDNPTARRDTAGSDHRPILATINLEPAML
jgi:predicted extracellular nuclease